jgi:hypothetical protein
MLAPLAPAAADPVSGAAWERAGAEELRHERIADKFHGFSTPARVTFVLRSATLRQAPVEKPPQIRGFLD